ncbi:MAG: hypothetical protein Q9166_004289 [cf. Caloplaca sp. 2 TL-2023]
MPALQTLLNHLSPFYQTTKTATGSETEPVAHVWADALQDAPAVAKAMWPPGPLNSQQLDLRDPPNNNPTITTVLDKGLLTIMSDIPTFLNFTSNGRFTRYNLANIPFVDTGVDLSVGVNTFVTSKLTEAMGFYAVPGDIMDETTFNADSQCPGPLGKQICNTKNGKYLYWSPTTHRSYELKAKNPPAHVTQMKLGDLMGHINEDGFADPELLFDGNYNCTAEGKAGQAIVNTNEDNSIDVSCVSQLPMYLDCGTACPTTTLVGGICPFGNWRKC